MNARVVLLTVVSCAAAYVAQAQTVDSARTGATTQAAAQVGPAIRRIATASSVSAATFGTINDVRELPDGRLLVNDGMRRQLLLLDTLLKVQQVVLDSVSETENTYGNRPGILIPHRADSTLFIDPGSLALLVIDPEGRVTRVRSVPRVQDVGNLGSGGSSAGRAGVDGKGRLVYRIGARAAAPLRAPPRGVPFIPNEPDSAFIVGIDLETRKLDTLGAIRIPKSDFTVRMQPGGGIDVQQSTNPLPLTDDWAVLSDGSVAFVRGLDYRVDYLNPDGSWTSSAKQPYEWQRVTDDDKHRIVDSLRNQQTRSARTQYVNAMIRWINIYGKGKYPNGFTVPERFTLPQGLSKDWALPAGVTFPANYVYACAPGEEPRMLSAPVAEIAGTPAESTAAPAPRPGAPGGRGGGNLPPAGADRRAAGRGAGGAQPQGARGERAVGERVAERLAERLAGDRSEGGDRERPSCIPAPIPNTAQVPPAPRMRDVSVIAAENLPDYRPPFPTGGAVRADADGGLWVRTIQPRPVPGGPVFDVVSRAGELFDRIQLPQGYVLAGFGRGRVVYVSMRDAGGIRLARVQLK